MRGLDVGPGEIMVWPRVPLNDQYFMVLPKGRQRSE